MQYLYQWRSRARELTKLHHIMHQQHQQSFSLCRWPDSSDHAWVTRTSLWNASRIRIADNAVLYLYNTYTKIPYLAFSVTNFRTSAALKYFHNEKRIITVCTTHAKWCILYTEYNLSLYMFCIHTQGNTKWMWNNVAIIGGHSYGNGANR